jgi:NDP-sugar pyrophosphorylase family protein
MTDDLLSRFVERWRGSPFGAAGAAPWHVTAQAEPLIRAVLARLAPGYAIRGDVAVHGSAAIEDGAVVKGPAIVGPGCLVAAGAYLRGGVWLEEACIVGPGAELKASFMFRGAALAHFNFVGDSILGAYVNLEAGAVLANHRNERADKTIRIRHEGRILETGADRFGALVGDGVRIGANAVIAPGALLAPSSVIGRLAHVDQSPEAGGPLA